MEANTWRLTVNEKKFIENALLSDLRVDSHHPFDYRNLIITFGKEDGSTEVQLGQTHVMGFVTGQMVQPYHDRSNEGLLSIFTEFSPMVDPSFEPGRPSEAAVELVRIVDRGLRESKAVDTKSFCVLPGKLVWAIRIDLHILDNGGNLVDTANIAALAGLMTFWRPECSFGYLYVGFARMYRIKSVWVMRKVTRLMGGELLDFTMQLMETGFENDTILALIFFSLQYILVNHEYWKYKVKNTHWRITLKVIGIKGKFPGPILNVTTNWNVFVNVKNNLDEPLLITWNGIQHRKNSWQDGSKCQQWGELLLLSFPELGQQF
ncbi:exosome complex component RRP45A-like [Humulus lupulus]|uniref:exosome complex component RRP45A-like n=1 Tax=Humulus lupulus TaxID=3486 RepID=UPI002B410645|nr:exosome complex component RRP45A-like [Humulus lupulus]